MKIFRTLFFFSSETWLGKIVFFWFERRGQNVSNYELKNGLKMSHHELRFGSKCFRPKFDISNILFASAWRPEDPSSNRFELPPFRRSFFRTFELIRSTFRTFLCRTFPLLFFGLQTSTLVLLWRLPIVFSLQETKIKIETRNSNFSFFWDNSNPNNFGPKIWLTTKLGVRSVFIKSFLFKFNLLSTQLDNYLRLLTFSTIAIEITSLFIHFKSNTKKTLWCFGLNILITIFVLISNRKKIRK